MNLKDAIANATHLCYENTKCIPTKIVLGRKQINELLSNEDKTIWYYAIDNCIRVEFMAAYFVSWIEDLTLCLP